MTTKHQSTGDALSDVQAEVTHALSAGPPDTPHKLQRRRTEDEMRAALRLLSSGQPRPRDDESVQILEDAIGEVFALRKLNMELMQALNTAYQHGVTSIRDLTSR